MRSLSKPRFGYTEKEMADSFLKVLQSPEGLPGIGPFDGVYREVSCRQGRPDFIALRKKQCDLPITLPMPFGLVGTSILTLLQPKASRTIEYIVSHSEYSANSVKRALRQLIASGHVERSDTGSYRLSGDATQLKIDLWCFELKLDNPRRAVFQAQQSRAYADRAIIVARPGQEKNYERYAETMARWNIGLSTFSVVDGTFRLLRLGRRSRAFNPEHRLYTVSRLLSASL